MLILEPFTKDLSWLRVRHIRGSRKLAFLHLMGLLPTDSYTCQAFWYVFQDGSNGGPLANIGSAQLPKRTIRRVLPTNHIDDISTGN